jgi:hypothetical protein
MNIARGQLQGDDLMAVVEDEVQFEAEEPIHLATLGQTGKCRLRRWVSHTGRAVESM